MACKRETAAQHVEQQQQKEFKCTQHQLRKNVTQQPQLLTSSTVFNMMLPSQYQVSFMYAMYSHILFTMNNQGSLWPSIYALTPHSAESTSIKSSRFVYSFNLLRVI